MPDREKVIKAYEDFVNGYECFCTSDDYEYEMHKAVLVLLKEQEAVEPIHDDDDYYRCRSCNAYVAFPNGDCKKSFCEKCGKAVKWNE